MIDARLRRLFLAPLVAASLVPALAAQEAPEGRRPAVIMIVPYAGMSVPTRTFLVDDDVNGGYDLRIGYLLGVRLQVPIRPRLAAHADIGYAASALRGFGPIYSGVKSTAHFVGLSARLAYQLTPVRSRVSLALNAGGGWMRHWIASPNPNYQNWPAAVAGIQVGVPLKQGMRIALGVESYLYVAHFGGADPVSTRQQDFRFTVGLLGGR